MCEWPTGRSKEELCIHPSGGRVLRSALSVAAKQGASSVSQEVCGTVEPAVRLLQRLRCTVRTLLN